MSLTSDKFSDAWRASASAVDPVPVSCALHKLAGKEGDAAVDVCITIKAADQQDFQPSRCACIFFDRQQVHSPATSPASSSALTVTAIVVLSEQLSLQRQHGAGRI